MSLFESLFGRAQPEKVVRPILGPQPCACLEPHYGHGPFPELRLHRETLDPQGEAARRLEELIEQAVTSGATEFDPGQEMPADLWNQLVALPASLGRLTRVRRLQLPGSHLVRIPPEIGAMSALEELDLYTSYRLHWMPYEVTHCAKLRKTCFSTRALYGNYKYRPPFPRLNTDASLLLATARPCSVCRQEFPPAEVRQAWISLRVGTDVLPLLVNACSEGCLGRLPAPAAGYVDCPHPGGLAVRQPAVSFSPPR